MHYLVEDFDGIFTHFDNRSAAWQWFMVSILAIRLWTCTPKTKPILIGGIR